MHWHNQALPAYLTSQKEARLVCRGASPEAAPESFERIMAGLSAEQKAAILSEIQQRVRSEVNAASGGNEQSNGQHDMWTDLYSGPEVDTGIAARETIAAGATGTAAAALAKIGTVSGIPHAVVTGGTGYVGWNLGRKYLGNQMPQLAGPLGATLGITLAPSIPALVQSTGGLLHGLGATSIAGLASTLGLVGGGGAGFYMANKMPLTGTPKAVALVSGTIVGGGIGAYASTYIAPALQPLLPVLHTVGSQLTSLGSAMVGYFPSLSTTAGALHSSLYTGGIVGALYGMGWVNGKINGYGNTGFLGNLWRGLTLVPHGLPKYLLGKGFSATRNAVTGNNKYVKAIASPLWWPVRTAIRPVLGLGEGLYSGVTGRETSDRYHAQGMTGSVGRGIGTAVTAPVWGTKKLIKHLLSPAS